MALNLRYVWLDQQLDFDALINSMGNLSLTDRNERAENKGQVFNPYPACQYSTCLALSRAFDLAPLAAALDEITFDLSPLAKALDEVTFDLSALARALDEDIAARAIFGAPMEQEPVLAAPAARPTMNRPAAVVDGVFWTGPAADPAEPADFHATEVMDEDILDEEQDNGHENAAVPNANGFNIRLPDTTLDLMDVDARSSVILPQPPSPGPMDIDARSLVQRKNDNDNVYPTLTRNAPGFNGSVMLVDGHGDRSYMAAAYPSGQQRQDLGSSSMDWETTTASSSSGTGNSYSLGSGFTTSSGASVVLSEKARGKQRAIDNNAVVGIPQSSPYPLSNNAPMSEKARGKQRATDFDAIVDIPQNQAQLLTDYGPAEEAPEDDGQIAYKEFVSEREADLHGVQEAQGSGALEEDDDDLEYILGTGESTATNNYNVPDTGGTHDYDCGPMCTVCNWYAGTRRLVEEIRKLGEWPT
ncbi:hypothetical protein AX17_004949 [Amanita inopinata Kibby_2008]|nr:hypothetical protein AX17_004949 [Amanita inopinata Kibby_2008]